LATGAKSARGASSLAVREADLRTSIRPTVAEVDLAALSRNAARIRATVGPGVAVFGVVKADAYGHGAVPVVSVLESLVDGLAVSLVEEGLELRDAGVGKPILVLGAYYGHYHSEVLEEGLVPVIYDAGEFERFGRAPVRRRPRKAKAGHPRRSHERWPVHVKIDTGMNRLGLDPSAVPGLGEAAARFPHLAIDGLCTHLASADLSSPDDTLAQLGRFKHALAAANTHGIHPRTIHAANSAGTVRFPEARFSAIRPGLALYGAMPSAVVARPDLEPVLSLRTRIMAMHRVARGGRVSYGGRWCAARESSVATLPIGYADGYPRHVEGAEVLVRGQRAKVVGAVCMDMMMVDVTDVAGAAVGDDVVLIGGAGPQAIRADDLARWSGTISYEILCGISKRVPRIYLGQRKP
jgi:alanine racemase